MQIRESSVSQLFLAWSHSVHSLTIHEVGSKSAFRKHEIFTDRAAGIIASKI